MDGLEVHGGHYVGEQFANKELLSYVGLDKNKQHNWMWRCLLCKAEQGPARYAHLKRSNRCGKCTGKDHGAFRGYGGLGKRKFGQIQYGANKRNKEFTITMKDAWDQWEAQKGICSWSGRDLKDPNSKDASLDRINSERGYIPGNIEWVHQEVNYAKHVLTASNFYLLCQEVAQYTNNPGWAKFLPNKPFDDPASPEDMIWYDFDNVELFDFNDEDRSFKFRIPRESLDSPKRRAEGDDPRGS